MVISAHKSELVKKFDNLDMNSFQYIVRSELGRERNATIKDLQRFLYEVNPNFRLRIMEALTLDGSKDLVPLFISVIKRESNNLYAKQLLYMFGNFTHPEAMVAFQDIKPSLSNDLRQAIVHLETTFKTRFTHHHQLLQLEQVPPGSEEFERLKREILANPDPAYIGYFNQRVLESTGPVRLEAIRFLTKLGDKTSFKPLFELLSLLEHQQSGVHRLLAAAHNSQPNETFASREIITQIADALNWSIPKKQRYLAMVFKRDATEMLEDMLEGYHLTQASIEPNVRDYYKRIVTSYDLPYTQEKVDFSNLLQGFLAENREVLKETVYGLACIAKHLGEKDFLKRIVKIFADDHEERFSMVLAGLAGFQTKDSEAKLWDYLEEKEDEKDRIEILEALAHYPIKGVPDILRALGTNPEFGKLRRRALKLIAQSPYGPALLADMLPGAAMVIQADVIQVIAGQKLDGCVPSLLELLENDPPDSMLALLLEGLSAFTNSNTASSLRRYLLRPYTIKVRTSAIRTCLRSSGEQGMAIITETLVSTPREITDDLLTTIYQEIDLLTPEDRENYVLPHCEFFGLVINAPNKEIRTQYIEMLYRLTWKQEAPYESWLQSFIHARGEPNLHRGKTEFDRLASLEERMAKKAEEFLHQRKLAKLFQVHLKYMEEGPPASAKETVESFMDWYDPEMIESHPERIQQLVRTLIKLMNGLHKGIELEKQAIEAACMVGHPNLVNRVQLFLNHQDPALRAAAEATMAAPINLSLLPKDIHRILVMTPNANLGKHIARLLEQHAYSALVCSDEIMAMVELGDNPFELLILEPQLQMMTGAKFLNEIRKQGTAPAFTLVISDPDVENDLDEMMFEGVEGILLKPVQAESLTRRLNSIRRKNQMRISTANS